MAGLAYLIPDNGEEIDFDLVISEAHTNASQVTDHPVEKGMNIADHVRAEPITLTLEVEVTNTPLDPLDPYGGDIELTQLDLPHKPAPTNPVAKFFDDLGNAIHDAIFGPPPPVIIQTLVFDQPFDRISDTHLALTTQERAGGTMTVVTSTANYGNMVLTGVKYSKTEAGSGQFTLDFKQARIVSTSTVTAPAPAEPRGATNKAKGSQATKPTDPGASQSLASKILSGVSGALGGKP